MRKVNNMSVIIYSPSGDGHHVEYLHHLYMKCKDIPDKSFVFIAPELFRTNMIVMDWPVAANISFDFDEVPNVTGYSALKRSATISITIRNKVKIHSANLVFIDTIMHLMPLGVFLIPSHIIVSGIIYKLFISERQNLKSKIKNEILYLLLSKSRKFGKLFILNDIECAPLLNEKFGTDRFCYLPDPVLRYKGKIVADRKTLALSDYRVFLHFGALSARKGTLSIFDSFEYIPKNILEKYAFIFAGKVDDDIKGQFYDLVDRWKDKVKIYVKDEFCSFDYIYSVCSLCDAILIPYKETSMSSGLIGYSASFHKPVIAPKTGLIGRLVDTFSLGMTCDCSSPESFAEAYEKVLNMEVSDEYLINHSIELFQDTVVSSFNII